jgi:hypothetical protein
MLLNPPSISTERFLYLDTEKVFAAEASDLGSDFELGRVYDDAADVGFTLVSQRTGDRLVFVLYQQHRDGEGELLYDEYRAVKGPVGFTGDLSVHIFND